MKADGSPVVPLFPLFLVLGSLNKKTKKIANPPKKGYPCHNMVPGLPKKVDGNAKPAYSSKWERAVAYHHGLYVPEKYTSTKTLCHMLGVTFYMLLRVLKANKSYIF